MKVLRADQYATLPWKNGGGTTREIAVLRDPGRHDDFLWRLSIATVAQPGPFSRFEGVDRTIALLAGQGMVLHAPGTSVTVTRGAPPFAFDGETAISCELLGGPTVDLNVMTRRGFFRHTLRRQELVGPMTVHASADQTLVVSNGSLDLYSQGRETLTALDVVADLLAGETCELYADRSTEIFIVELMAD